MAKQNTKLESDSFISATASIAAPLIQIIAITSVALTDQLKLADFFYNSEYLSLVNFFIIFITLSLIGIIHVFKNNLVLSFGSRPVPLYKQIFHKLFKLPPPQPVFRDFNAQDYVRMRRWVWFVQIPTFILFLLSVIVRLDQVIGDWGIFLQYLFYSSFLVASGIVIFTWLQDFQRVRKLAKPKDYFSNLIEGLRIHGTLPDSKTELISRKPIFRNGNVLVLLKIDKQEYIAITDYLGEIIWRIWKKSDTPNEILENLNDVSEFISQQNP